MNTRGLPWEGRQPAGGGVPPGGKDHFFFCGKRNGPSPQRKRGARSMQGLWTKTAASGFSRTLGTTPGRYGHPIEEQGKDCGSILGPPGDATLAAECGGALRSSHPIQGFYPAAGDVPDHPGPERGTRRRLVGRVQARPCSSKAGRNGREGSPMSYESRWPLFSPISPA